MFLSQYGYKPMCSPCNKAEQTPQESSPIEAEVEEVAVDSDNTNTNSDRITNIVTETKAGVVSTSSSPHCNKETVSEEVATPPTPPTPTFDTIGVSSVPKRQPISERLNLTRKEFDLESIRPFVRPSSEQPSLAPPQSCTEIEGKIVAITDSTTSSTTMKTSTSVSPPKKIGSSRFSRKTMTPTTTANDNNKEEATTPDFPSPLKSCKKAPRMELTTPTSKANNEASTPDFVSPPKSCKKAPATPKIVESATPDFVSPPKSCKKAPASPFIKHSHPSITEIIQSASPGPMSPGTPDFKSPPKSVKKMKHTPRQDKKIVNKNDGDRTPDFVSPPRSVKKQHRHTPKDFTPVDKKDEVRPDADADDDDDVPTPDFKSPPRSTSRHMAPSSPSASPDSDPSSLVIAPSPQKPQFTPGPAATAQSPSTPQFGSPLKSTGKTKMAEKSNNEVVAPIEEPVPPRTCVSDSTPVSASINAVLNSPATPPMMELSASSRNLTNLSNNLSRYADSDEESQDDFNNTTVATSTTRISDPKIRPTRASTKTISPPKTPLLASTKKVVKRGRFTFVDENGVESPEEVARLFEGESGLEESPLPGPFRKAISSRPMAAKAAKFEMNEVPKVTAVTAEEYALAPRLVKMQVKLEQINKTIEGFNTLFAENPNKTFATEKEAETIAKNQVGIKGKQALIACCTFKKLIIDYEDEGGKIFKRP